MIADILRSALAAVREADLPEEYRMVAFDKAIDLIAHADRPAGSESSRTLDDSQSKRKAVTSEGSDRIAIIAARLKVPLEVANGVFLDEEGEISLAVPPKKLDASKNGGTKQIALLLCAGRQAAGMEESTSLDKIRACAADYKRLDSPNFSKSIEQLSDVMAIRNQGKDKGLRLSRPGWEEASTLVSKLGGNES